MAISRPRLASHVFARKYVGGDRTTVVLHDGKKPRTHEIGARGWAVVAAMDGTRDAAGIAAASGRASEDEVAGFVAELEAAGLVEEGVAGDDARGEEPERGAARPIERLAGFALRCDGRGGCCRLYPSIVFAPEETARARGALPMVQGGGHDEASAFMPERGLDRRALSVALIDGHCAYLARDLRCGIHAATGAGSKPFGCRSFPLVLIDDGASVRATPAIECACVIASGVEDGEPGEPLLDEGVTTSPAIDPRHVIDVLPARVALAERASADRALVRPWADAARGAEPRDVAAAFFALAAAVRSDGLDPTAARDAVARAEKIDSSRAAEAIAELGERAARRAREPFRSERDLARQAFSLVEAASVIAGSELEAIAAASAATAKDERFYFDTVLFGHHAFARSGEMPLADALEHRGVRVLVARAMRVAAELAGIDEPAFRHPLAILEATIRGYGLVT